MTDMAYIVSRTLENKIAIAENNDQNTLLVTIDVLKEILSLLKEQEVKEQISDVIHEMAKPFRRQIVMCKDCIWFHKPDAETKKSCKCNYHGCVTEGDRYCWWGEKDA